MKPNFVFKSWFVASMLFIAAFLPRAFGLGVFIGADEWVVLGLAKEFLLGVAGRDFNAYAQTLGIHYPAFPSTVLGALGLEVQYLLQGGGLSLEDFLAPYLERPLDFMAAERMVIALAMALSVVVVYLLGRKLLGGPAALLGAAFLAFDPFFVAHSRLLHIDGHLAAFMAVALLSFMVYLRERRAVYLMLSALATALALLTKSPASFLLPFAVLVALGHFWAEAKAWKAIWAAFLAVALWGIATLALCYILWPALWVAPELTLQRMLGTAANLGNVAHHLGTFFLGRNWLNPIPLFYPVVVAFKQTPLACLGLAMAVIYLMKKLCRHSIFSLEGADFAALVILTYIIIFLVFMSMLPKKADRYALPVFPAIDLLAAFGWVRLAALARQRWPDRSATEVGFAALILLQAGNCLPYYPYYLSHHNPMFGGGWAAPEVVPIGRGEGLDVAARYLNDKEGADAMEVAAWYSVCFAPVFIGRTTELSNIESMLRADYTVFYVNQVQRILPISDAVDYFRPRLPEYVVRLGGVDYAWVYPGPIYGFCPPKDVPHPSGGIFAGRIRLLGYDLAQTGQGRFHLTLYWETLPQVSEPVGGFRTGDYSVFLRLLDEKGHIWGRRDAYPVGGLKRTSSWEAGAFIVDEHDLEAFPGTTPGQYRLEVGLYNAEKGVVADVAGGERGPGGGLLLGEIYAVRPARPEELDIMHRAEAKWGEIELLGYDFYPPAGSETCGRVMARPGDFLPLTFYWRAEGGKTDCLLSLWLEDEKGQAFGERALPLCYKVSGTSEVPGTWVWREQEDFLVKAHVPPGRYRLMLGLKDGKLSLGEIEVQGRPRLFEAPQASHPLQANLGGDAELLGYDLSTGQEEARLTLYWRALTEMQNSYTVFVHLLDDEGRVQAQRDSIPGGGQFPTTGWMEGEIIVDEYVIPAPPGKYLIEVGMYQAESGKRLPVIGGEEEDRIILGEVEIK
ncbi:MAG: ArnT family glycosyltransferase [Anaerolineae bacterium]